MSFILGSHINNLVPDKEVLSKEKVNLGENQNFLIDDLACQCLRCNKLYFLYPCSNCNGNGQCYTSQTSDGKLGIFCGKCTYGQTEWVCRGCQATNLMNLTLFSIGRRTKSIPQASDDYLAISFCFEEMNKPQDAIRVIQQGYQKFSDRKLRERLVDLLIKNPWSKKDEPITFLKEELKQHPNDIWLQNTLADCAIKTNNRDTISDALELLQSQQMALQTRNGDDLTSLENLKTWVQKDLEQQQAKEKEQRQIELNTIAYHKQELEKELERARLKELKEKWETTKTILFLIAVLIILIGCCYMVFGF